MKNKRDTEHEKRMRKMILLCGLCAIILSVSTYAWFIGMKTVNVSTFNVDISSVESLYLSLDGKNWANTVTISESNYMAPANDGNTSSVYTSAQNNTNAWGQLIPLSSIGTIDGEASTLIMYEKGSLTATKGGYRILTKKSDNESVKSDYSDYIYKDGPVEKHKQVVSEESGEEFSYSVRYDTLLREYLKNQTKKVDK